MVTHGPRERKYTTICQRARGSPGTLISVTPYYGDVSPGFFEGAKPSTGLRGGRVRPALPSTGSSVFAHCAAGPALDASLARSPRSRSVAERLESPWNPAQEHRVLPSPPEELAFPCERRRFTLRCFSLMGRCARAGSRFPPRLGVVRGRGSASCGL